MPAHVAERLVAYNLANSARSLRHAAHLVRIIDRLGAADIPVMPIKGPVWAQVLYGDLTARQFSDLDILVRFEDLARAEGILAELGYQPAHVADAAESRPPLATRQDVLFHHPESGVFLELHWRLARRRDNLRLSTEELFSQARPIDFLGREVLVPGLAHLFVYLAVHAANHGWGSLEHLRGLGEIVTQNPEADWTTIAEGAAACGARRRIHVAVLLLSRLGVAFPRGLEREAHEDVIAQSIETSARATWGRETSPPAGDLGQALIRLKGLDRRQAQAAYGLALVFEPDEADWGAIKLPEVLSPLYYVVRPTRLVAAYGKREWKRIAGGVAREGDFPGPG